MPLNENEERILQEIEQRFLAHDPESANRLGSTTLPKYLARNCKWAALGFLAGLVVLLVGFASSWVVGVFGFAVMLGQRHRADPQRAPDGPARSPAIERVPAGPPLQRGDRRRRPAVPAPLRRRRLLAAVSGSRAPLRLAVDDHTGGVRPGPDGQPQVAIDVPAVSLACWLFSRGASGVWLEGRASDARSLARARTPLSGRIVGMRASIRGAARVEGSGPR